MEDIKNFSIFIFEDDKIQATALKNYINEYSQDMHPVIAASTKEAISILSKEPYFRAYFLDISTNPDAENTDGLKIAEYIRHKTKNNAPIIFTTAFPKHIYHAVNDIHCTAYLLKPYTKEQLFRQLDNILGTERDFTIKTIDNIRIKLNFDDVFYFESHGRYITAHTLHGEFMTRQYRLKQILELFPAYFEQCHKSYIVNTRYIYLIDPYAHLISLKKTKDKVPCNRNYRYIK